MLRIFDLYRILFAFFIILPALPPKAIANEWALLYVELEKEKGIVSIQACNAKDKDALLKELEYTGKNQYSVSHEETTDKLTATFWPSDKEALKDIDFSRATSWNRPQGSAEYLDLETRGLKYAIDKRYISSMPKYLEGIKKLETELEERKKTEFDPSSNARFVDDQNGLLLRALKDSDEIKKEPRLFKIYLRKLNIINSLPFLKDCVQSILSSVADNQT